MGNVAAALLGALLAVGGQEGENVARGKRYSLDPAPNYVHCTDPEDRVQLTDGVFTKGYFWTQKSTVGWSGANPVTITIDLGKVESVSGLSYGTAGGVAGVLFPQMILILASEDGKTWRFQGDLVELAARRPEAPEGTYAVHRYRADGLAFRARFVKLMVSGGTYVFADEIEVFRGPAALLQGPPGGREVGDERRFFAETRVRAGLVRRLRADAARVWEEAGKASLREGVRKKILGDLEALEREIPGVDPGPPDRFRTVFPINDLHRRIFRAHAAVLRGDGPGRVVAWAAGPWDMLDPFEVPPAEGASIDVAMMRNEVRSAAFNLTNTGTGDAVADLEFEGLPGGPDPPWITVHEVQFTDTLQGIPVAAALPEAPREGGRPRVGIPAGMTRQVWLTIRSRGLPAGEHRGAILLRGIAARVPLVLRIYPLDFPETPALHLGGWDYTDGERSYQVTPRNREAFIRHLRERFVDTPWARASVLPPGRYDAAGEMTEPPPDGPLVEWVRRWPGARNYYVFAAVRESFAGFPLGSPSFEKAVSGWIRWWVGRLKGLGIRPGQLGLLLVDEPHEARQDRIIVEYARVVRRAEPEVVIWEDPTWPDPSKASPELFEVCTVLCPNLPMWLDRGPAFARFYLGRKEAGKRLWLYSCSGPGKLLDPYSYHRLQPWFCFRFGAEGCGYWAFGDSNGAPSWNEYLAKVGAYTPLFLDEETVTAGKHMEAIREGIEDYEYLRLLRERIEDLERRGVKEARVEAARRLLESAPERVTGFMTSSDPIHWRVPKDRGAADRVRREILEVLAGLSGR